MSEREEYPSNTLLERSAIPTPNTPQAKNDAPESPPSAAVAVPPSEVPGKKKKGGLFNTFCQTFFEVDAKTALTQVAKRVIIPSAQDMLMDSTESFLNTWFHGLGTDVTRRARALANGASYNDPYWSGVSSPPSQPVQQTQSNKKRFRNIGEMVAGLWWPGSEGYQNAKRVYDQMIYHINHFESVTVYDLWTAAGVEVDWATRSYGWMKEDGELQQKMQIVPESGGYRLVIPQPTHIE